MIDNFELWQQSECDRLGCTVEQHSRLLEIAGILAGAGLGGSYEHLVSIITMPPGTFTQEMTKKINELALRQGQQ